MRNRTHPKWSNWQSAIEAALANAMKQVELTSYRINGAATRSGVSVKSPSQAQGTMPYVQAILSDVLDGWDDSNSGGLDYEGVTETNLDGDGYKILTQKNYFRERLIWTIEVITQKYEECIEIANTIRMYFGPLNTFTWIRDGVSYSVPCKLDSYTIEAAEADRAGNVEYFRASWNLVLDVKSILSDTDKVSKGIIEVVVETTNVVGSNESAEEIKTITS